MVWTYGTVFSSRIEEEDPDVRGAEVLGKIPTSFALALHQRY